ncbi:MAG: tripartite tricarboxylate transporter substrate-binding protein [Rubrivivax sp.]
MKRRGLVGLLASGVAPLPWGARAAEAPIRLVYPYAPGGAGDALARLLADEMQRVLARPVIVENRTGAAGRIGVQSVRDASADGTTLLLTPSGPLVTLPHLRAARGYEPLGDLVPLQRIAAFEVALAIDARIPAASLPELVAWLKANPDRANYGTPGVGSQPHLTMVALAKAARLELTHVPYAGTPQAMNNLMGGSLSMICAATGEFLAAQRSGKVRLVAVAGDVRSVAAPEVPTLRESGVDIAFNNWYALYAAARTPRATLDALAQAARVALETGTAQDRIRALGFRLWPGDADSMRQLQQRDSEAWSRIIHEAGIKIED